MKQNYVCFAVFGTLPYDYQQQFIQMLPMCFINPCKALHINRNWSSTAKHQLKIGWQLHSGLLLAKLLNFSHHANQAMDLMDLPNKHNGYHRVV